MRSIWRTGIVVLLLLGALPARADAVAIALGPSVVALNGPWRFHTGDDPRWAAETFDDSQWEAVDLTPLPGAHDSDVGFKNYVPGWSAKGHRGYVGYAWYRMAVRVSDPHSDTLWLAGPADVDNIYQVFLNGHLIGGIGDFSQSPPTVVSIQPRMFALPRAYWDHDGRDWTGVIAFRVVLERGAFGARAPDGGGIHIAPLIGDEQGVGNHYRLEWLQTVEGYTVDAVEAVLFVLLAIMALCLLPFERDNRFYPWLAFALVLLAAARGNQPFYFLTHVETMHEFAFSRLAVDDALTLMAWALTWFAAFGARIPRWAMIASAGLALIYMTARLLTLSMFFPDVSHAVSAILANVLQVVRIGFLLLMFYPAVRASFDRRPGYWLALLSLLAVATGLFAPELSLIGVPGIWFPFGVGVSRTEYAYAVFDALLYAYLIQRLWRRAPGAATQPAN